MLAVEPVRIESLVDCKKDTTIQSPLSLGFIRRKNIAIRYVVSCVMLDTGVDRR